MMKTLLTFFVLLFSSSVLADGISDFEIEGISIGESLLDYFSEEKIKSEIERTKSWYSYLPQESGFGEVYKYDGLDKYYMLSFMVKPDDDKYIIYSIRGSLPHEVNMSLCYKKMDEISISCIDFEEKLRIKNNWIDGLDIAVDKKEVLDWLSQH